MAIHPIPDNNKEYMSQQHGTSYLITDPQADALLASAHRQRMQALKELKTITDSWTI
jgi:hypothetical protein